MTPLDQAPENHMSRFSVRKKKSISDDGSAIIAQSLTPTMTDGSDDRPTILAAPAPVSSTESNAMTRLDQAIYNNMCRFNVRSKRLFGDDGQAILARSLPPTMTDGGGDLIKAITNCEGALAELRRALVASFEYLGQQTMSPPVDQATKPTVKA